MLLAGTPGVWSPAHAETLRDALAATYLYNPTLKAKRAELRAQDEEVPRAKSGYRPTIIGQFEGGYERTFSKSRGLGAGGTTTDPTDPNGGGTGTGGTPTIGSGRQENETFPKGYTLNFVQPLFRGFRTVNAVRGAEAATEAVREELRATEQTVFLNAVTAYMDVVRDQSALTLNQNNLRVLSEQERATADRFRVGEVTRTDTSQAQARRAGAESAVSAARAQLNTSRATYRRIIGNQPGTLVQPAAPKKLLPNSEGASIEAGENENPNIITVVFRERAQEHLIKQIQGELLPEVTLEANTFRGFDQGTTDRNGADTVVGRVTVPLYLAGEPDARVRQAFEVRTQLRLLIDEARQQARSDVVSAYGQYQAAKAQLISDQAAVDANRVALSGVREEERVGQRTLIEVLNAEQELLNTQVTLVSSQRNAVVAAYTVLSAIGRLSMATLDLAVEQYDPAEHFEKARDKWAGFQWDTSVENSDAPLVKPVGPAPVGPNGKVEGPAYRPRGLLP